MDTSPAVASLTVFTTRVLGFTSCGLNAALAAAGSGDWDFRNGDQETGRSDADGDEHLVNLKTGERRTGDASDLSQTDSPTIWIA